MVVQKMQVVVQKMQVKPSFSFKARLKQETNGRWMPTEFGIQVQERQL